MLYLPILKLTSMETIHVKDKDFTISIKEEVILKEVDRLADELNRDLADKEPMFLGVLNGSFMFMSDLMKRITIPCQLQFMKVASYAGTDSTGKVTDLIGIDGDVKGRTVVIIEDIIDTGTTMKHLVDKLQTLEPKEILICTFLMKPNSLKVPLDVKYVAMSIPNDFILGYGLDYDGYGRNYPDIYTIVNQ